MRIATERQELLNRIPMAAASAEPAAEREAELLLADWEEELMAAGGSASCG